jgi:uncharacterized membrane protein YebE (DUF533 family)
MGLLDNLQSVLTSGGGRAGQGGGMSQVLGPAVLGGLISAILPGKSGGMLRAGGATALATILWDKYQNSMRPAPAPAQQPQAADIFGAASGPNPMLARLIRAMVFAAKSDGHIDEKEKQAINSRLAQIGSGPELSKIASAAVSEPLDPAAIARGVSGPEEAMAIFVASCSVIELDHFMENSYIDALANALGIPPEAKEDVMKQAKA